MVLVLYTIPKCPYCKEAKTWLRNNGVNFMEVRVFENKKLEKKLYKKTNSDKLTYPIMNISGNYFNGWLNEQQLKKFKNLLKIN